MCIRDRNTLIQRGVTNPSIKNIAECVHSIRSNKLPNYKKIGNAGSFFKNPLIKKDKLKEIPISSTFGLVEIPADACADNFMGSVSGTLDNLFATVGDGTNLLQNIASATEKIKKLSNAPITASMESLYTTLIPNLQGGLERLYQTEYTKEFALQIAQGKSASIANSLATIKGINAQKGQINPIKGLQNELDCLGSKIASGLTDTVRGLIEEALTEVVNTGACITEQFAGSLLSSINNKISELSLIHISEPTRPY